MNYDSNGFPKVLRAKEAAKYLGVSLSTFNRMVKASSLEGQRVFLSLRATGWTVETLDNFVRSRTGKLQEGV